MFIYLKGIRHFFDLISIRDSGLGVLDIYEYVIDYIAKIIPKSKKRRIKRRMRMRLQIKMTYSNSDTFIADPRISFLNVVI